MQVFPGEYEKLAGGKYFPPPCVELEKFNSLQYKNPKLNCSLKLIYLPI